MSRPGGGGHRHRRRARAAPAPHPHPRPAAAARQNAVTRASVPTRIVLLAVLVSLAAFLVTTAPRPASATHTLPAPTGFVATATNDQVLLEWDAVTGARWYKIEYSPQLSGLVSNNSTRAITHQRHADLDSGRFFVFRVRAEDRTTGGHTASAYTPWVTVMTQPTLEPGAPDPTFGAGGMAVTSVTDDDEAHAVAVQPDGKIVAAGFGNGDTTDRDFAVARYNVDGTLDTGFGNGGKVVTAMSAGERFDEARAVAVQPDGKIVVAGSADGNKFAVARYNTNGTLDTDFSSDGKVVTAVTSDVGLATAVAVQPDGKILAAGTAGTDFAVVRYTAAGALDTSFSSDGKVVTDIGSSSEDAASAMVLQTDGKIVVAGFSGDDIAVVRYTAAGALDTSFSSDGKVTTSVSAGYDSAFAVVVQSDNKIVVAGEGTTDRRGGDFRSVLVRYTAAGALDTSFGSGGEVVTNFNAGHDGTKAMVLQSDGKIVTAGYATSGTGRDFAVVRYFANGELDPYFGAGGKASIPAGGGAEAVALQPDGKIVAAGHSGDDFAVVRWLARSERPTLVSNFAREGPDGSAAYTSTSTSQGFTTGTNPAGYILSDIDLEVAAALNTAAAAKVRAELWSDSGGSPAARLETLTVPAALREGRNMFKAPAGTVLAPETAYHIVVYTTAGQGLSLRYTNNDDEDRGAYAGWAIADAQQDLSAANPHSPGNAAWTADTSGDSLRLTVRGSPRPAGSGLPVWSATLRSADLTSSTFGCATSGSSTCATPSVLSNAGFVYDDSTESVTGVSHLNSETPASRRLVVTTTGIDDTALKAMTLHVGHRRYPVASGSVAHSGGVSEVTWSDTDMVWSASDQTRVMLTIPDVSNNNNLSNLAAAAATRAAGPYSTLTLAPDPFAAGTVSYTATVGNDVTHAKLIPTVEDTGNATVNTGKQDATLRPVADSSAGAAVALDVGDNILVARVAAENGDTKDYTVTIRRQSNNTNLAGLAASTASSATGPYSAQTLTEPFNAPGAYTAVVEPAATHAKLTPTVEDTGNATVKVGKQGTTLRTVPDGTASAAIALRKGANRIIVRVTAENGDTRDYTATITRDGIPDKTAGLTVIAGSHSLGVAWTPPEVTVTGYDVHYTTKPADELADDTEIGAYRHPSGRYSLPENPYPHSGWTRLAQGRLDEPKYGVGGLTPGQTYRFRVRAYNRYGTGPWAVAAGTPGEAARTVSLSASPDRVREGDPVTITATVNHNGRPTPIQEDLDIILSTHLGTAEAGDLDAAQRISIDRYTARGSVTIPTHRDADTDDETFAVLIRRIPKQSFARPGDPSTVWVTITEGDPAPPEPEVWVPQLRATGGDRALRLAWSETSATGIVGYDVEHKRSTAPDRSATAAGDPSTGWVDAGHSGIGRSVTVHRLDNGVSYDARVRLVFRDGTGGWSDTASATTTPTVDLGDPRPVTAPAGDQNREGRENLQHSPPPQQEAAVLPAAVTLTLDRAEAAEDTGTVIATATLDVPAPPDSDGIRLQLYPDRASTADHGTDYTMPAAIVIPAGQRTASAAVTIIDDTIDEPDETLTVAVFADTGYAVLSADAALTITDNDAAASDRPAAVIRYDTDDDGVIDHTEYMQALRDHANGRLDDTGREQVEDAYLDWAYD